MNKKKSGGLCKTQSWNWDCRSGPDPLRWFPIHRQYLIEGRPGTGKTTLALQFLLEGRKQGERGLYVTLSEAKDELRQVAESHGWSLSGVDVYELESSERRLKPEEDYTVFRPEDAQLNDTIEDVYQQVDRLKPTRAVFDSLSEMRLLARDPLRYRRQILVLCRTAVHRPAFG